ncbi:helix-turn-helix transcriptional regulator [Lentzea sp. NPDC051208]|uniref:ArsR/SmtB family transcription factor n=1 Tax=Lentzea sp. NPDC051208 TaxID=3154642 RepID=UPI0034367AAB
METSLHVVMQHLSVLREADLVLVEPQGRKRVNHLNPVPIQQFHQRWVSHYEENCAAALVVLTDGKQVFVVGRVGEVAPPLLKRPTEGTRMTLRDSG